jgi:hypothetical protein
MAWNAIRVLTVLAQVASVLEEAWAPEYTYIGIIIDTDAIQKLQVNIQPSSPPRTLSNLSFY